MHLLTSFSVIILLQQLDEASIQCRLDCDLLYDHATCCSSLRKPLYFDSSEEKAGLFKSVLD